MRTTIDLPDSLFKQAKATAALRGVKLRQLIADALDAFLAGGSSAGLNPGAGECSGVPRVTASDLARYPNADELRRAFPNGYRIVGPMISGYAGAPVITAERVAEMEARMEQEELETHGRPR